MTIHPDPAHEEAGTIARKAYTVAGGGPAGWAAAELAARTSDPMMHRGVDIIKRCAKRFREYERSHADKGTKEGDEKADRNADMAALCEQFITKLEAQRA